MAAPVCRCVTDDQLRSFRRAFKRYQTGDCLPGRAALAKALREVGVLPTETEIDRMLLDVADPQRIDLIDFVIVIYYFLRGADTDEELIRSFAIFDEDRDGKIPIETSEEVLRGLKRPVPDEKIDELMRDLGRDGLIDYAEMIRKMRPS
jgi:Ca2+-binding EF-hand superfamily protein